jgi:signal peptidase I
MKFRAKNIINNIISAIITTIIMIVGLFSITGIVFYFVSTPAPVSSFSMYPTLNKDAPDFETEGDWAYLNRYTNFEIGAIMTLENRRFRCLYEMQEESWKLKQSL